jgi:adenylate cyclase
VSTALVDIRSRPASENGTNAPSQRIPKAGHGTVARLRMCALDHSAEPRQALSLVSCCFDLMTRLGLARSFRRELGCKTMMDWLRRRRIGLLTGVALFAGGFCVVTFDPGGLVESWREQAFDVLETTFPRTPISNQVVVVDIDRTSFERKRSWPWPRDDVASLIEAIAACHPAVIAIDMLLTDSPHARSGAGPSEDSRLTEALRRAPTVLGIVLDPDSNDVDVEGPPIGTVGAIHARDIMIASGVDAPSELFRRATAGLGVLSLPAPNGEPVRGVPLLAIGGSSLFDGLAVEAVRVGQGDVTLIADASREQLRLGAISVPLQADAVLRLHFASADHRGQRTISAGSLSAGSAAANLIAGKIVFLGSSAPEAGGLRTTAADAYMPSVQIHANAAEQLLDQWFLHRPHAALLVERGIMAGLSIVAILAGVMLAPLWASLLIGALIAVWIALTTIVFVRYHLLVDPLMPSLVAAVTFQGTSLASFASAVRERRAMESHFARHLSPAVVRRISQNPDSLRLLGEELVVTALFTDMEKFTALTERTPPQELIAFLNIYLDRVTSLVVDHGGMVDKLVGDAVHALFYQPRGVADHTLQAINCATAIIAATETIRREPTLTHLGLGRTRIGIETGPAVVGDVGGSRKLDFTAYGSAINTAAKLEASNKVFGSSIAVGPRAVAACPAIAFRPLGLIAPSPELERILVCEPWPCATGDDLAAYQQAYATTNADRGKALEMFTAIAARYPDDKVLSRWIERLQPT